MGVTQGFTDLYECVVAYERFCYSGLFPSGHDPLLRMQEALRALAAFLNECDPPGGPPHTEFSVLAQAQAAIQRCCFPGCYQTGVFPVQGKENTMLSLCERHQNCVRSPDYV